MNEIQVMPNVDALVKPQLTNDDIMSVFEVRLRRQMNKQLDRLEEEKKKITEEKCEIERNFRALINDELVHPWLKENFIKIKNLAETIGIQLELETLLDDSEYCEYRGSYDHSTKLYDDHVEINVYIYKKEDSDSDDNIYMRKRIEISEETNEKFEKIKKELECKKRYIERNYQKISSLKNDIQNLHYNMPKFRGELLDNVLSKSETGTQLTNLIDETIKTFSNSKD